MQGILPPAPSGLSPLINAGGKSAYKANSLIFLIISEKSKKVNRIFFRLTGKNDAEGKKFLLNRGCFQKIHGKTLAKKFFSGYSLTAEKI